MTGNFPMAQTYKNNSLPQQAALSRQAAQIPAANPNPALPETFPLEPIQTASKGNASTVNKMAVAQKDSVSPKVVRLPPVENSKNSAAQLAAATSVSGQTDSEKLKTTLKELPADKTAAPMATSTELAELDLTDLDKIFDSSVQSVSYTETTEATGATATEADREAATETATAATASATATNTTDQSNWQRATDQENIVSNSANSASNTGKTSNTVNTGNISNTDSAISSGSINNTNSTSNTDPANNTESSDQVLLPELQLETPIADGASGAAAQTSGTGIQVASLVFATSIRGRGDCTRLEKPYRFSAGETVLLYSEVNLSAPNVSLQSGYELKSSNGTVVFSKEGACGAPEGEVGFYQSLMFKLPSNLEPGNYTITVWVEDTSTQRRSDASVELEIVQ